MSVTNPVGMLLGAFVVLLMAGCSSRVDHGGEIVFWAMGAEGERVQALIPEFERRNPGIKVRVQMIPWNAAHEKLLTSYAGNSTPDLCQLGNTWIPEFVVLDAIEPLDAWMERSVTVKPSSYFPGIWDTNVIDSAAYGIPWYVDTRVMFYRTDALASVGYNTPPRSWMEWFELCAKLKIKYPQNYTIFLPVNNEWAPAVLMGLQMKSRLLKEQNTRADFSGKEFTDAMHVFHDFFKQGWAPTGTRQFINLYQAFSEGIFVQYVSGPWNIGEFSRRIPPELQDKWMTSPLPGPEGEIGVSLAGGSSLVMFKASTKKEQVWKLIEYLSEPQQQLEFYKLTGDLPGRIEAWEDSALATNKYASAFFEQLNHVIATPKIPEWEQIAQKVRVYSEYIAMDQLAVNEALTALDRDVDRMLEKRRWLTFGR